MEDNFANKKSVDQAWSAMKDILDKEMPVKEEKVRLPFVPLFLGVVLLLCMSFVLYFSYSRSTPAPIQKEKYIPAEVSKEIVVHDSAKTKTKKIQSAAKTISNQEDPTTQNNTGIKTPKSSFSNKLSVANSPTTKHTKNISQNVVAIQEGKQVITVNRKSLSLGGNSQNKQVINPPVSNTSISFVDWNNHSSESIAPSEVLLSKTKFPEVVTTLAIKPTNVASAVSEIHTKIKPFTYADRFKNAQLEWAINIYAARRLIENNNEFNTGRNAFGYLGGFDILFTMRINKDWRMGSGLGYKLSTATFGSWTNTSSGGLSFITDDNAFAELGFSDVLSISASSFYRGPSTQFVSIPVFVERRLSKKWYAEAGLRYNQKIGNYRSVVFKEILKSNVDFYLTPSFAFSKRWSLGLMLQYSTNQFDVKNTDILEERGRTQLGIVSRIRI